MEITWDRLGSSGICDVNKLLEEDRMLIMIPVSKNYSEFFVVCMCFLEWMEDDRSTEPIDILSL